MSKVVDKTPTWTDIASKLDPMLPADQYDQVRRKYFVDVVVPRIPKYQSEEGIWQEFKKRTERAPLLSTTEKFALRSTIAAHSAMKSALELPAGLIGDPELAKSADRFLQPQLRLAEREGMSVGAEKVGGALVGELPAILASFALAEPIAGALVSKAGMVAKNAVRAKHLLAGGLAFGALDAAKEQDGSRFVAGAKGFAEGMLWTLPVIPFVGRGEARTLKEGLPSFEDTLAKASQEPAKVPELVHQEVANQVAKQSKILRSQEVLPNSIVRNPKVKGIVVSMLPKEGNGVMNIDVLPGKEAEALVKIRQAQVAGADFNALHFNPQYEAKAFKFLREARDSEIWKYEDPMIVEVQKGLAEQVSQKIQKEIGVPATALSDRHVELQVKRVEREKLPSEEGDLTSQLEASLSKPKPETKSLPEGVAYIGGEKVVGEADKWRNMYSLEVSPGKKTTFTVYSGEDVEKKVADVRAKWTEFNKGEATTTPEMTEEKAAQLVKEAGYDPAKADLGAVRALGEEEFNRLLEVREKTKAAGADFDPLQDWMEKVARTKAKKAAISVEDLIPLYRRVTPIDIPKMGTIETMIAWLKGRGKEVVTPQMKLSMHPFRASMEVPTEVFEQLNPGARAAMYHNWRAALEEVGIRMPKDSSELYPAVMFSKLTRPEEKYHEFLHAASVRAGLTDRFHEVIPPEGRLHAFAIASNLEKLDVYAGKKFSDLLDEAFTYSATAVKYGKSEFGQQWLEQLTQWNGDEAQIKEFVKQTAESILKRSQGQLDSVSERIMQRKMTDLIRRADKNISYGISTSGASARWNPDSLGWTLAEEDGRTVELRTTDEVWDYLLKADVSDTAPSLSFGLEALGVRGPMAAVAPLRKGPTLPTVGLAPEEKWVGWSSVSGWFRPFLPWVASLDTKINAALAKRGESFGIFDAVKKVDEQVRGADKWLTERAESLADILKGTPDKRMQDYFNVLTYKPDRFGEAASKYGLAPKEIEKVRALEEWLTAFRDDTKIQPFEWLREMYPRFQGYNFAPESMSHLGWQTTYDPKSAGFWEKAVRENELRPDDTHIGRFAYWLMREGYQKQFTGEPLRELSSLINRKVQDARGIEKDFLSPGLKWPLQNYVKYVQGIPDQTQQVINRGMKDFLGYFQGKIKDINKTLPAGLKIPGSEANISPRILQRLMTLSYAGALGLRPAVAVRDGLQVLSTTLPVLGAGKFSRGFELMFDKEARRIADEAGVFLTKTNIGELYGDILGEIPIEGRISQTVHDMANVMLAPSRWGDNFARGLTFLGEYDSSLRAIKQLRSGALTQDKFLRKTSLWFLDDPMTSKLLVEAQDMSKDVKEVAKRIALETVDLTQWPFRRGTQPAVLRTGLGRIFGQFGRWPANYADFLARIYQKSKGGEYRTEALKSVGMWLAANYAASSGMEALGADVSTWYFVSPTGYSASPHLDLVQNLLKSPEESDEGRSARRKVLQYPLNFIPAKVEMENILNAMHQMGPKVGILDPELVEILGFRPKKREPDLSPEDLASFELGFGKR